MFLSTYLFFDGDCESAFHFYEKTLGGKVDAMLKHSEAPGGTPVPSGWRDKIMHAHLTLGAQTLMGSDAPPEHYSPPRGFSVSLAVDDPAEAERLFAALAQGGEVTGPIQETFWARRFGTCVDRFGIPWMVNCAKAA